ncbi:MULTISPECIES: TonB-dependent receptor domain-containing protein [Microbulbifer]|uniref:TonB-dependent receptor domain-containing protein n=1 Tax=Microbulbifer TaxID=48073 RepID=UPI001E2F0B87|nr:MULTISPECIES: TonB-dependent receptor [Microbulbifer]UHQ54729.1 TonB-dependent receptor [Microbulbifer sp. YPW16]
MHKKILASAIRTAIGFTAATMMLPVMAQDDASNKEIDAKKTGESELIEEVYVTGSRIARAGYDTMQPASSLDKDFFDANGYTNVADALNSLPMMVPSGTSLAESDPNNVGQSFADFYGLGSQRTLTLVNGRRVVAANAPTAFGATGGLQVDLNSLPTALIERVDVVSVGGAPIYGSDAIAGTINVILRDDFEGVETEFSSGFAQGENDAGDHKASITFGQNFAEGRGNVVASYEYNKADAVLMNDRAFTGDYYYFFENPESEGPDDGIVDKIFDKGRSIAVLTEEGIPTATGGLPLFAFGLNMTDEDGNPIGFGADGHLTQINIGEPSGNIINFIGGDGLLLQNYDSVRAPIERNLFNTMGHYDLTDRVQAYAEINYYTAESSDPNAQPFYQSGIFGGDSAALPLSIDNPYLNARDRELLTANGIPAGGTFYLHKGMNDLSQSGRTGGENEMFRYVLGLKGDLDLAGRDWTWDFTYNKGETSSTTSRTQLVQANYEKAIDVTTDANGNIVCVSADPDCVPLNVMGTVTDQAAISYVTTQGVTWGDLEQEIISLNTSGDVIDLPAGPLSMGFGYEMRDEFSAFRPDDFMRQGLGRSAALSPLSGGFDTKEFYTEALIPVLPADLIPTLEGMEIEGAWRNVDHSQAGDDDTWSVGTRIMFDIPVVGALTLRGNVTESIRAPAVTEALLPLSETFSSANDPCDERYVGQGENPAQRRANCEAEAAAAGYTYDPNSYQSEIVNATKEGFTGGNPDLLNERADASTWGFVWAPGFTEGLELTVDWVNIDIEDAIEQLSLTVLMEACYDGDQGNVACDNFTRDENFQINGFTTGFRNAGFYNFRGVQSDLTYNFDLANWSVPGSFDVSMKAFHIKEQQFSVTGKDLEVDAGEIGYSDWQGQFSLAYNLDNLTASWQTQYIGEANVDNDDTAESRDIPVVPEYWLNNAYVGYQFNDNLRASLSVRNVFDEEPPTGVNSFTAIGLYDILGRYVTAGVSYNF